MLRAGCLISKSSGTTANHVRSCYQLISKWHMTWWVCPILEYSQPLPSDRSMCFLWLLQCFLLLVFFIPAFEGLETPGWPSGLVSWKDPWQAGYWSKHYSTIAALKVNMEEIAQDKEEVLKVIPPQYHQCWKVFSEHASHWFPSACKEDHAIVLKEGAPDTIDCRVYHQTETELEATWQFIMEALVKGYITDSKSPYMSGLFYWKKKDGKLWPIMDHCTLNQWTVWDTYPLPLISNILDHLQGKNLFTKIVTISNLAIFNFHFLLYNMSYEVSPMWLTPVYLLFTQVAVIWLHLSLSYWTTSPLIDDSLLVCCCDSVLGVYCPYFLLFYLGI